MPNELYSFIDTSARTSQLNSKCQREGRKIKAWVIFRAKNLLALCGPQGKKKKKLNTNK